MENTATESDELLFKDVLEKVKQLIVYFFNHWKIIFIAGFIGGGLGIVYSYIKKPIYTATLSYVLEDENSNGGLGGALSLAGTLGLGVGSNGGGGVFSGSNLTELFKSRNMVEKTLLMPVKVEGKEISLAEMYIQINKWRDVWNTQPKYKTIQFLPTSDRKKFTRVQDSILGVIYSNLSKSSLSIEQKDKKTAITSIEVASGNELFSFYFCEALAKQVGKFYIETKSKKARTNMEILYRQTDSIRRELNGAIHGMAVANDNTFMLNPAHNVQRAPSSRRQVDIQTNTAILAELVKQSELAKITLRKETPLIQVIDRPILPLPKEKFGKTKGLLIGGFLAVFISLIFLLFKKLFSEGTFK
ncbi:Chain length determinant protein [Flavobacterium sp. ACN2]|uniref:Wzz/FepE/Etk N-terminal domain-containing protein n=1 Tax=unclassified Flavobacterium TaxID=196869 RepID=UPI000BB2F652|nr:MULTISPECIES: Wzz/FepE/Etk N-terminal domain-containing protein [unclassified Flavobacterium]MDY0987386.1 Wzz/FepE/Etk N-terminal domain-containing protein [Flavobacterium sp. CFBP9031]PBI84163.1 Chain length determinant protein [Flavobacterium sp. ACN2]